MDRLWGTNGSHGCKSCDDAIARRHGSMSGQHRARGRCGAKRAQGTRQTSHASANSLSKSEASGTSRESQFVLFLCALH